MFKNKSWLYICLTLMALKEVISYSTQYLGNTRHPTLPNHCFHEDYNLTIPILENLYPTHIEHRCFKLYCREDYVLEMKYCDRVSLRRNCIETPSDYSKPYPECCPTRTCNNI